ncbi:MAG TPA: hypothetical protein VEJ18_06750, partial [Planctomycetota bacterium]|nr:hypothetical protein [Planctomycetota bacterium]
MKGWLFYACLMLAVYAERLRTFGRRMFWSVRGLIATIFLPAPSPSWDEAGGRRAKTRLRALHLARLARSEKERAAFLGRQAKLVLRLGSPRFARQIAWDAFRRWKA